MIIDLKQMDNIGIKGSGFNSKTGGFEYIIIGDKKYRAMFIVKLVKMYELLVQVEKEG